MAELSMCFGLRAVEATSVSFNGEHVTFMGAKGRKGRHSEVPGPWAQVWGEFLRMLRARHGYPPGQSAWFPMRVALHKGLNELVGRPELVCKSLRWHSWRGFGAAQLRLLGAPTNSLLSWGGWATPSMFKIYAYPPASRTFHRGGPLPVAEIDEKPVVHFSEKPGTTLQLWAPWLRADIALVVQAQSSSL